MYNSSLSHHQAINLLSDVINRKDLPRKQAGNVLRYVYENDKEGLLFSALTVAIHTKGETPSELAGIVQATQDLMPKMQSATPITDTSGTGGGAFKTINVSTLTGIVVSAAGHKVLKTCYSGITSKLGSADVLKQYDVDVFDLTLPKVRFLINKIGFSPYYQGTISPKLNNRSKLIKKFFIQEQISITTPYHLITNICSPASVKMRVYGCYSKSDLHKLAHAFRLLGYKHVLIFSADIGMPEISNTGPTHFAELKADKIKQFTLTPEKMGVKEVNKSAIASNQSKRNIKLFKQVLQGTAPKSFIDLVALNAGASLYVMEDLRNIKQGVAKAQALLNSNKPLSLFQSLTQSVKEKS